MKMKRKHNAGEQGRYGQWRNLSGQARAAVLALPCLTLLAAGCLVGPDYQAPQPQVPEQWAAQPAPPAKVSVPTEQDLARWWTIFNDPVLISLEARALKSNLDLRQAWARLRQARAARGIAAGGLGPQVGGSASYQRSRSPYTSSRAGGSEASIGDYYQAGFDASWELDIFGGRRRELESADAQLRAAEEASREVRVSLAAEVARSYLDLRTLQQRAIIARANLAAQQHTARLTKQRQEAGFVSGLDAANAEAQAATTAAQIPLLESSARQTIHALGLLLGQEPAALIAELAPSAAIPQSPPLVPAGVPSDLLRRRPDIRQAEARLHAATAKIGVATADLFPRIYLTGGAGYQSSAFQSWFDWAGRFWNIGPSLNWRIFESGRIRANIELQEALAEESLLAYRQTVLNSLREVEDSLVASTAEQDHQRQVAAAVAANRRALGLATMLYSEGQVNFLNVLQAQGALYASEDALVRSVGAVSTNLIALYKALGGGWQPEPDGGAHAVPVAALQQAGTAKPFPGAAD